MKLLVLLLLVVYVKSKLEFGNPVLNMKIYVRTRFPKSHYQRYFYINLPLNK